MDVYRIGRIIVGVRVVDACAGKCCTIAGRTFSAISDTSEVTVVDTLFDVVERAVPLALSDVSSVSVDSIFSSHDADIGRYLFETYTTDWNAVPAINPNTKAIAAARPSFATKPVVFFGFLFLLPLS